ncbi:pantoate kinase [Haloarcula onubensis]|uniref:Pantoate kinase n=1 Tax=Haloarcula onubensis TaxID=2950539 RepID=A0ABU2FJT7_9EURY|nr:pantoate kinase [Halomicroarcula sp. S3CR25-11]MDS0281019.1 pantoate kinase [Halomicroarcula sp. S3CR25-11]
MSDDARAFVPGHVTGFFTVDRDDDPTKAGSRGGGIALSDGVSVTVEPAAETTVELDGESVAMGAVERVLSALRADARVTAETPLPLGAGFGVSGATALGTALAANAAFERGLSYNELVTVAHGAEVQAGTGLGDVVGQARGGVPLRLDPGGPQHNYVDAIPERARVEYYNMGELSTPDVVGGDTEALTTAGERALSMVVEAPTLSTFTRASRQFSREADLLTDDVREVVSDVTGAGGDAAMAMLGETVFALGTGLTDAGYDARSCAVYPAGATLDG